MIRATRKPRRNIRAAAAACLTLAGLTATHARADDKSRYNLFNPTPAASMREMSTDRPDLTESPFTVDAGHVQAELSFVEYAYDHTDGRTDALSVLPTNLKLGLTNNVDLQLVLSPYENERTKIRGHKERIEGFGETIVRLKVNLWGNDGGDSAGAVMPYVKFPTGRGTLGNDHVEGGIIFPVSFQLPKGFELGAMAQVDFVRDADNRGYGVDLLHTVTLSHDIVGSLGGYVEYTGLTPVSLGTSYQATADVGLTYQVNDNVQLDGGVNIGLSRASTDLLFFVGLSVRR